LKNGTPLIALLPCIDNEQTKTGAGLAIEAAVQDGAFVVEGASYFPDSKLATDSSAEGDWKRRTLYLGPQVRPLRFRRVFLERQLCLSFTSMTA
jgi:hypothetical protein